MNPTRHPHGQTRAAVPRAACAERGPSGRRPGHLASVPALALALVAALLAGLPAAPARAADACPLIRPSDLSPAQVDQIVADKVAIALQRPAAQLVTDQSLQAQAGSGDAAALFGYTALAVGEALGFDAAARFQAAAQALGPDVAAIGLTLATLQAISRQAYQAGTDSPPPLADPQRVYALDGLQLRPPALASGWYPLRCGHDQITFWRRGAADNEVATAVARISGLPAGNAPFRLQARFCYANTGVRHGPTLLCSHAGSDDVAQFKREADAFLDAASALP